MPDEKKKRGKPKRYKDEESERISVLVRPRYKKALELIRRNRDSTLSEAMELAIYKLASEYIIDGKKVIDYVRSKFEIYETALGYRRLGTPDVSSALETYSQFIRNFKSLPISLHKPSNIYCYNIIKCLTLDAQLIFVFPDLTDFFNEYWKIGIKEEYIIDILNNIGNFFANHLELLPGVEGRDFYLIEDKSSNNIKLISHNELEDELKVKNHPKDD